MSKTEDRKSKAIFINLTDEEGSKLYIKLNIHRVGLDITWKEFMLSSLGNFVAETDTELADQIIQYIDKKQVA